MKKIVHTYCLFSGLLLLLLIACKGKNKSAANEAIEAMNLKRGAIVSCGPPNQEFGLVAFQTSCSEKVKKDLDLALAMLHSFEYDEAEKVFAKVIDAEPGCAVAYWGVAMSNFHPLWAPPTQPELEKGSKAIAIARSLPQKSKRESDYIETIAVFYKDWNTTDHITRCLNYEKAMEKMYTEYPDDKEAAIFYALALDGAASPSDKSYAKQKKAATILNALYPNQPNHPGVVHYIIHSYDNPELAILALPAARQYASLAPSSAHAQHMPSHIFTRLGLWEECIQSNLSAAASAKCYAQSTGIKGHWDEELHCLDYLMYAYLQKGDNIQAKAQLEYLKTIHDVDPPNFKVAYAFASIPSRYLLENRMWKEAAAFEMQKTNVAWEKFPWQKGLIHFTRLFGAINTGNLDLAKAELKNLTTIYDTLVKQKDTYKANQIDIQIKSGAAWIAYKEGRNAEAIQSMTAAADLEDKILKLAVTPGEILPARELLGDMLLQMNKYKEALTAYEANLKERPNRFNGLYSAALAAERSNNMAKANEWYQQLVTISTTANSTRPEVEAAKAFLKKGNGIAKR